jgi:hypothetical protein
MINIIIFIIILILLIVFVKKNNNEHYTQQTNSILRNVSSIYNNVNKMISPNMETNNILSRNINSEIINNTNNKSTNINSINVTTENVNAETINNININKWKLISNSSGTGCWRLVEDKWGAITITTNNCDPSNDECYFSYENNTIRNKKYPTKCLVRDNNNRILQDCDTTSGTKWLYIMPGYFYNPSTNDILEEINGQLRINSNIYSNLFPFKNFGTHEYNISPNSSYNGGNYIFTL